MGLVDCFVGDSVLLSAYGLTCGGVVLFGLGFCGVLWLLVWVLCWLVIWVGYARC